MFEIDEKEMFDAEYKIENAIGYLRHTEPRKTSLYKRNLNRNIIAEEMRFLKENFPDSYILSEDLSDIDLVIEKPSKV